MTNLKQPISLHEWEENVPEYEKRKLDKMEELLEQGDILIEKLTVKNGEYDRRFLEGFVEYMRDQSHNDINAYLGPDFLEKRDLLVDYLAQREES